LEAATETVNRLARMPPLALTFAAGAIGSWAVDRVETIAGAPLAPTSRLEVFEGKTGSRLDWSPAWVLRGVTSNERYVSRIEHDALVAKQEPLGRAASTPAALIPITKSEVLEPPQG